MPKFLTSLGEDYGRSGMVVQRPGVRFAPARQWPGNPKLFRNLRRRGSSGDQGPNQRLAERSSYTGAACGATIRAATPDQIDGGSTGRNSPDTTAFVDRAVLQILRHEWPNLNNGPLPTDRPNTFKGYVYYPTFMVEGPDHSFGLFSLCTKAAR